MKVNIVDPGSAKRIVERKADKGEVIDVIGLSGRVHEPIGACYVGRYATEHGHEVDIIYPHSQNLSIEEMLQGSPKVVGFSTLTFNYPLALEAAKRIKHLDQSIVTVIGGYHATMLPEEVSSDGAFDFVVQKEGDFAFTDLIDNLEGRISQEKIRGIVYRNGELFAKNAKRVDPNENPIPLRNKDMISGMRRYGLYSPAPSDQKSIILLVSSRGCNYDCSFCPSSVMFPPEDGTCVKYRDIGNIIQEVSECQLVFGTNYGFFVDLNFGGGNKQYIKELSLALSKTGLRWYVMSRLDVDPEVFEYMFAGGCTEVGFGVESMTKPLKGGFKGTMQRYQEMVKEKAALLKNLGMISKGYFILGNYDDTKESLEQEKHEILQTQFDEIRLSFMIYSPGTPIFNRLQRQGRFTTSDLSHFSTDEPVIRVQGMAPDEMKSFRNGIYADYYSPERYDPKARHMVARFPHLEKSYAEFNQIVTKSLGKGFQ